MEKNLFLLWYFPNLANKGDGGDVDNRDNEKKIVPVYRYQKQTFPKYSV